MIHTPDGQFLLMRRTPKSAFDVDFWQSVTGSLESLNEPPKMAAARELWEETGLKADAPNQLIDLKITTHYRIFEQWQHRYAPNVTENMEHQFALCVPNTQVTVQLSPAEHTDYIWLPWADAAARCFSPSNAAAIRQLVMTQQ
jgi:dihydroneopterin triphosphate diphosphatase